MPTGRRSFYDDPQQFLDNLTDGLLGVERWAAYPERSHRDNGLRHAFQTGFLAKAMLALERAHGDARDLDGERIVSAGFSHDLGEWLTGDVRYEVRQDSRVRDALRQIERELFEQEILRPLSEPVQQALVHASGLQDEHESRSGRFFNAVERIGYIIFALREYRRGHAHFVGVFARQHGPLLRLEKEFTSVRMIYDHFHKEVEEALEAPTGRDAVERQAATLSDAHETLEWLRTRGVVAAQPES
jgi:5'-deoxynucleotidase YfbR-like HD superfamily hydrolase